MSSFFGRFSANLSPFNLISGRWVTPERNNSTQTNESASTHHTTTTTDESGATHHESTSSDEGDATRRETTSATDNNTFHHDNTNSRTSGSRMHQPRNLHGEFSSDSTPPSTTGGSSSRSTKPPPKKKRKTNSHVSWSDSVPEGLYRRCHICGAWSGIQHWKCPGCGSVLVDSTKRVNGTFRNGVLVKVTNGHDGSELPITDDMRNARVITMTLEEAAAAYNARATVTPPPNKSARPPAETTPAAKPPAESTPAARDRSRNPPPTRNPPFTWNRRDEEPWYLCDIYDDLLDYREKDDIAAHMQNRHDDPDDNVNLTIRVSGFPAGFEPHIYFDENVPGPPGIFQEHPQYDQQTWVAAKMLRRAMNVVYRGQGNLNHPYVQEAIFVAMDIMGRVGLCLHGEDDSEIPSVSSVADGMSVALHILYRFHLFILQCNSWDKGLTLQRLMTAKHGRTVSVSKVCAAASVALKIGCGINAGFSRNRYNSLHNVFVELHGSQLPRYTQQALAIQKVWLILGMMYIELHNWLNEIWNNDIYSTLNNYMYQRNLVGVWSKTFQSLTSHVIGYGMYFYTYTFFDDLFRRFKLQYLSHPAAENRLFMEDNKKEFLKNRNRQIWWSVPHDTNNDWAHHVSVETINGEINILN